MNANLKTALLCILAVVLSTVPAVAAETTEDQGPSGQAAGPCEVFYYTLDPPGYQLDLSCLWTGPLFDNSP